MAEMMIVVVIIGIIAALGNQYVGKENRKNYLQNVVSLTSQAFRLGRGLAFGQGREVTVQLRHTDLLPRIEVFVWNDTGGPGLVDWVDLDGDNMFDSGEGEVAEVIKTFRFDKIYGNFFDAADLNFRPQGGVGAFNSLCTNWDSFGEAFAVSYAPRTGMLMMPSGDPCSVDFEIEDVPMTRWSRIMVSAAGMVVAQ